MNTYSGVYPFTFSGDTRSLSDRSRRRSRVTARKPAVIIWNMVVKGTQYISPEGYLFLDQKRKPGVVKRNPKHIANFERTVDD